VKLFFRAQLSGSGRFPASSYRGLESDYDEGVMNLHTLYDPAGNLLSRVVLGSRPSLTISKTHSGNFTGGQTASYSVTVSNAQGAGSFKSCEGISNLKRHRKPLDLAKEYVHEVP
jgi:hypothetical protein